VELARGLEKKLAHTPGVKAAVRATRDQIAGRAAARLAGHRDTGNHRIETSEGAVDAYVDLVGRSPLSLEFGRAAGRDESGHAWGPMEPLAILRGAIR
jgi:Family of unknown function (DUF5403)